MSEISTDLIDQLLENYRRPEDVLGEDGLLKQLTKAVVERALAAEMSAHLGYEKYAQAGKNSGNSRNGSSDKKLVTNQGTLELSIPRDRNGEFEPQLVRKGQRRIAGFDDKIIALYSRGMSTRDIQTHLREIYATDVSAELISRVTDAVMDELHEWQNRPLEKLYTVVYLDALWIKVRHEGRVVKKAVYLVVGINEEGMREVLGFWLHSGEGAASWMQAVTELRNRGVEDILIACVDGLKGLPQAIESVFPQVQIQLCIVHLIRNTLKHVNWKDRKALASSIREVYAAPSEQEGLRQLKQLAEAWPQYPHVCSLWQRHWEHIIPMFQCPDPVRKLIYTTNAIEALNSMIRRRIRNKASFPSDNAAMKLIYLALRNHKLKGYQNPIHGWEQCRAQLSLIFEDKMTGTDEFGNPFTQKA